MIRIVVRAVVRAVIRKGIEYMGKITVVPVHGSGELAGASAAAHVLWGCHRATIFSLPRTPASLCAYHPAQQPVAWDFDVWLEATSVDRFMF